MTTEATTPAEMPLTQHLAELRTRLVRSLLAIIIGAVVCANYTSDIFSVIQAPLRGAFLESDFIGTGPADAFVVGLQVAVLAGFLLASPYVFYQLWCFISPGLHDKEKNFAIPFVFCSTLFFAAGVYFCYRLVLPFAFDYFYAQYTDIQVKPQIRIDEYLAFVVKMALVFGTIFELPILSYFLARVGILSHTWLIKQARVGTVAIFILAAILTPPDVVSQMLLAIPLMIIYGLSILIAYYVRKPAT